MEKTVDNAPHDADAFLTTYLCYRKSIRCGSCWMSKLKSFCLIEVIGEAVDAEYLKEAKDVNINPTLIEEFGKDMKIVCTPLHGTGEMLARRALAQAGALTLSAAEAQATADPDFSTVKSKPSRQPSPLLKNLSSVQTFLWQLTLTLTVLVLKFFKRCSYLNLQATKSVLSWLNTSWKLTKCWNSSKWQTLNTT